MSTAKFLWWLSLATACFTCCRSFSSRPFLAARQSTSLFAKQLQEFIEPTTGVTVKLVGSMHYNPASIQLVRDTIQDLAQEGKLGSVVIESCDIRWKNQMNPFVQALLESEMRAACDLALLYKRPVVLGDQRINITVSRLGSSFKESLVDLVSPTTGWKHFAGNLTVARKEALPMGDDDYLGVFSFFDPKLLLAAPVSLAKYPLSFLVRSPILTVAFLSLLFLTDQADAAATAIPVDQTTLVDWLTSLGVAALETALFARVFLQVLLAERNKILARNILEQCKVYRGQRQMSNDIMYVNGSNVNNARQDEMAVVAVLGMAHCNGIMKLLKEKQV